MNKFFKLLYSFLILSLVFIAGCTRDELIPPDPGTVTSTGVYILSEGSGAPNSTALSFYDVSSGSFSLNIVAQTIGAFPDGLILSGNELYMTAQGNFGGAGKIYKMDTTGSVISSNDVGTNPYSLAEDNGKLYLTNGPSSNVKDVQKSDLTESTTIPVESYPQEILNVSNNIFVCNTTAFGGPDENTVSVIDPASDQVISSIIVGKDPSALARLNDGNLIIGCADSDSYIYIVNPTTFNKIDSFQTTEGCYRDIVVNENSNEVYFIGGGFTSTKIMRLNIVTGALNIFLGLDPTLVYYGLSYDSRQDRFYLAMANLNFSSAGKFRIIRPDGSTENEFTTGVGPRRIVIR